MRWAVAALLVLGSGAMGMWSRPVPSDPATPDFKVLLKGARGTPDANRRRSAALAALNDAETEWSTVDALEWLAPVAHEADLELLESLAWGASGAIAAPALLGMGRLETPEATTVLIAALEGPHGAAAGRALGWSTDPRALPALMASGLAPGLEINGSASALAALLSIPDAKQVARPLARIASRDRRVEQALVARAIDPWDPGAQRYRRALLEVGHASALEVADATFAISSYPGVPDDEAGVALVQRRVRMEPSKAYGVLWGLRGKAAVDARVMLIREGDAREVGAFVSSASPRREVVISAMLEAERTRVSSIATALRRSLFRMRSAHPGLLSLARSRVAEQGLSDHAATLYLYRHGSDEEMAGLDTAIHAAAPAMQVQLIGRVQDSRRTRDGRILLGLMNSPERTVRERALAAVTNRQDLHADGLPIALAMWEQDPTARIAGLLREIDDPRATTALVDQTLADAGRPSTLAATHLGSEPSKRHALVEILPLIPPGETRRSAVRVLLPHGDLSFLRLVIAEEDPELTPYLITRIRRFQSTEASSLLLMLAQRPENVRAVFQESALLDPEDGLELARTHLDGEFSDAALVSLVLLNHPDAYPLLSDLAEAPGPLRANALGLLARLGEPTSLEVLRRGLQADGAVVSAAIDGLAALGGEQAAEALVPFLNGPHASRARRGLRSMGGPVFVRELGSVAPE